jgi:hypothetical protein
MTDCDAATRVMGYIVVVGPQIRYIRGIPAGRCDLMNVRPSQCGADISDNDHSAAVTAGELFSDIPAHDPTQRRVAVDDSPAAMRLLRAPFAVPSSDASRASDSHPDHQR